MSHPHPIPCDGDLWPDCAELSRLLGNSIERKRLDEAEGWLRRLAKVIGAMRRMEERS